MSRRRRRRGSGSAGRQLRCSGGFTRGKELRAAEPDGARDPQVPWSALLRFLGPQRDWLLGPREPPAPGGVWGGAECRATGLQRTPAQEPASAVERWLLGRARRVPHASGPGRPELDTQSFPLSTSRVLRGRVIQILLKSSGPHYDSHRVCSDECARVV